MEESDVLETAPVSWPALIVAALVPCCCLGYCLDTGEDEIENVDEVLTVPERVQRIESLIPFTYNIYAAECERGMRSAGVEDDSGNANDQGVARRT